MRSGEMFIIDHQDARIGPASYDIASLLGAPCGALDAAVGDSMLEHFLDLKSRSRTPLDDADAFRAEFELMIVQRMLKAIGTYASQASGNDTYCLTPAALASAHRDAQAERFSSNSQKLESTRG